MKDKFLKVVLSKWYLLIGIIILLVLLIMPLNSPLQVPEIVKPFIGVLVIMVVFYFLFVKEEIIETPTELINTNDRLAKMSREEKDYVNEFVNL